MFRSVLAVAVTVALLAAGCSGEEPTSAPPSQPTTASPTPTPTPTPPPTDDLSTVYPPDPPPETTAPPQTPVQGTRNMTCTGTTCTKKVSVGSKLGPLGPLKHAFTVTRIKQSTVTFLIKYTNGKRATLDLGPGDYAPFGDYDISIESIDPPTAIAVVEPPRS